MGTLSRNYKGLRDQILTKPPNVRNDLQHLSIPEISYHQPKLNYAVSSINILGDINLGTMIRTAVIFGARRFYVGGRRRIDARSTVGAENYIEIIHLPSEVDDALEVDYHSIFDRIAEDGFLPCLAETGGQDIKDFDRGIVQPCFVFGNEGIGFPNHVIEKTGYPIFSVTQLGVLRSLNVSVACGIMLHEFVSYRI